MRRVFFFWVFFLPRQQFHLKACNCFIFLSGLLRRTWRKRRRRRRVKRTRRKTVSTAFGTASPWPCVRSLRTGRWTGWRAGSRRSWARKRRGREATLRGRRATRLRSLPGSRSLCLALWPCRPGRASAPRKTLHATPVWASPKPQDPRSGPHVLEINSRPCDVAAPAANQRVRGRGLSEKSKAPYRAGVTPNTQAHGNVTRIG